RPPVVVAGVVPLTISSRDTAPFGMGLAPSPVLNRLRNRLLEKAAAAVLAEGEALAQRIHQDLHGTPMPGGVLDWQRRADAIAQFTVPELEYPRSDAPEHLHFLGPINASGSAAPLPEWWSDLDGTVPVVHVTQGTVANADYDQAIAPALVGLADLDALVVVATGGRPLDTLPPLPPNARAAAFLPYDELLPKTDVFVTNGGYGGVHYALRYGVPVVATGGKEDKPEVGARIAWSGVGRRLRTERPSPSALGREVRRVLSRPRYRETAQRIAERMRAAPGLPGLERIVDDLVAAGSDGRP
ncbi:glycosyltransferase, partial [Nocardioides albidus]|uniref:glycosyltransferase n=1 Tax=Nocardioides albidus TaxID=1517589 RepID=UPI001960B614